MASESTERTQNRLVEYDFEGEPKVAVSDLDVFYGDDHALADISISVPENGVTALIGPSGCGKSTFLRCLNRMNDRIAEARIDGSVRIDGEEVYRRGITLVGLGRILAASALLGRRIGPEAVPGFVKRPLPRALGGGVHVAHSNSQFVSTPGGFVRV